MDIRSCCRILVSSALFTLFFYGVSIADSVFSNSGQPIDADTWLEDAEIDPVFHFVGKEHAGDRSCYVPTDVLAVYEFFENFNWLVEQGKFDELDVSIVWVKRECLRIKEMLDVLGIKEPRYYERLKKIREELEFAYRINRYAR